MAPFVRTAMRITTLNSRADACARACAVALGFSIPISVALDNILLGLILAAWLASGNYRHKASVALNNRVAVAGLTLFCLLMLGITYSYAGYRDGLHSLGKYLDLAFIPIFVDLFRHERERRLAWLAFAAALALTIVLSTLIWSGLLPENPLTIGNRQVPDVFKRYLTQSIFLAFGAYLFVHLAERARSLQERRIWFALALLAALNVLVLTQGRTGQLVLLALSVHYAISRWGWKGAAGAATAVVLVFALMTSFEGSRLTATPGELQSWSSTEATTSSTGLRYGFYRNSLEIARAHPIIGTGTGSFSKVYAEHVAGTAMTETTNPHDEYLNIAIQLGIVGLAAMLYLFHCEWRLAATLPRPDERCLARALVITFAIGCAFNSMLMDHTEGLFFAWASGLLFAQLGAADPGRQA